MDKIKEISQYLGELSEIVPDNYESYERDLRDKSSCERYFEKIVVASVDLGYLIIRYKKFDLPTKDKELFEILEKGKVISPTLAKKLNEAKGMRNILAHEYGKVRDDLVYEVVKDEIIPDVEEFLSEVEKLLVDDGQQKESGSALQNEK